MNTITDIPGFDMKGELEPMAEQIAQKKGIPVHIFKGLIDHESSWNPYAKNPESTAAGLGQHLDKTLILMGEKPTRGPDDPRFNPQRSLELAADHLLDKYEKSRGDWRRAVMNYGEGNEAYIRKVEKNIAKYYKPEPAQGLASRALEAVGNVLGPNQAQASGIEHDFVPLPQQASGIEHGFEPLPQTPQATDIPVQPPEPPVGMGQRIAKTVAPTARPLMEGLGLLLGGSLGAGGGLLAGPAAIAAAPIASAAGAGLGYGLGRKGADALDAYAGIKPAPSMVDSLKQSAVDIPTGAVMEGVGQIGGVALPKVFGAVGSVGKSWLSKLSGKGLGSIEGALKGGEAFTGAMRGKISNQDIVDSAQSALQSLKKVRDAAYKEKLAEISQLTNPNGTPLQVDITPIQNKIKDLLKDFRATVTPRGTIDHSGSAIGDIDQAKINRMIELVETWPDKTPLGIDALKRRIGGFYSETSEARSFTSQLYDEIKNQLENTIIQYGKMTKPYSESKELFKNIKTDLMLGKKAGGDTYTADQVLNRLTSVMRDNHELRRSLLAELGRKSGVDLSGMVAGQTMQPILPSGLRGILGASGAAGSLSNLLFPGKAVLSHFRPELLTLVAASSPRVQGEFLNMFGKALAETKGMSAPISKAGAYFGLRPSEQQGQQNVPTDNLTRLPVPLQDIPLSELDVNDIKRRIKEKLMNR
jgi:hypothetical protein